MDTWNDWFDHAQQGLFEAVLQPLMFALGLGNLLEDGFAATAWLLVGLLQIAVLVLLIMPLERWRAVEPVTDWATVRTDVLYTLIHRLGLFRLAMFFTLEPVFDWFFGALRVAGWGAWQIDQVWPGVSDRPVLSFLLYLVVFDFINYLVHRAQHQSNAWWALHALHHAQRQMTVWSDNRNHLLDDVIRDAVVVVLSHLIGVAPGQFIALVALTQLSESLQHANLRVSFGAIGERLWVSPRFHRLHHAVGVGHESHPPLGPQARGAALGGHNFGVLLPWWDMLLGSARFDALYAPTGVRDQVELGRDYGRGFWSQQWLGVQRLLRRA